jgi:lysophospholipase L1-like esterase
VINYKKQRTFFCCALLALALSAIWSPRSVQAQDQDQAEASTPAPGQPSDPNLLYVGRWDKQVPTDYHGNWIGSYVRTVFSGTSVGVKVGGHAGLVYVLDGQPPQVAEGGPGVIALNQSPLDSGNHSLLVAVKGGGGWDFQGLVLDPEAKTQAPEKRPLIEFIGDSISCGSPQPIEAAGNYNWLTAEALGCDHTQISWPGRALTTGYGCQSDNVGLDIQYFQQNCFYDRPRAPWDFSTYTPNMIVINLGQNDGCGQEPENKFTASYVSFLTNIRNKFPKVPIVSLTPFSGGYHDQVQSAVETVNGRGDPLVYCIDTKDWLQPGDFVDGVHPNVAGNTKLVGLLKPLLLKYSKCPVAPDAPTPPAPVTVGDPNNPAGLAEAIQEAYDNGDRNIVVQPGSYLIPDANHPVFPLKNWEYATLTFAGCTITDEGSGDIFNLSGCHHVTIKGPVIARHSVPCGTQGRVTEVGRDPNGNAYCDWQVDAGYGTNTTGFDNFDVVLQETRKLGRCDLRNFKIEPLSDSKFRIHWSNTDAPMRVGDWLVHRYHAPGCAVRVSNSHDSIIDGVTSQNGGHATFFESDGSTANHFLNCGIACGPKPPGATEEQLVSNWADGIHSIGAFPGPDIENFTDSGILLDDCVAIHGGFNHVISSDPARKTVTLDDAPDWLVKVGEPLRVVNHTYYAEANVVAIKDENGKKLVTLDQPLTVPVPADSVDPLRCGAYYQVVNSHIGGTRSRGILAKADGGMIRNTTVADCGIGIQLGPGGGEAGYFQDTTVADDIITGCREWGMNFESNSHVVLRGVRVLRNHFLANPASSGDLHLFLLDGGLCSANTFTPPSAWPSGPKSPIFIEYAHDVTISGNKIESPDKYGSPLLRQGVDVVKLREDVGSSSP